MIARSFWGARTNKNSADKRSGTGEETPVDSLLDARIEGGRLSEPESAKPAARPATNVSSELDELDIAVQKLSEGLEAIERQGRAAQPAQASAPEPEEEDDEPEASASFGGERDFVAHSLDRLEARLEALSKRLQQRGTSPAAEEPQPTVLPKMPAAFQSHAAPEPRQPEPTEDDDDNIAAQLAESRRLAEAEEAAAIARRAEAEEAATRARRLESDARSAREAEALAEERRRETIVAEARRHAEALELRRQAELTEARREAELAEMKREAAEAEVRRQTEIAEARRHAEAAEKRRLADLAEARRLAEAAEAERQAEVAEALSHADAAEKRRQADLAEARRLAEAAEAERFAEMAEARRHAETLEKRRIAEAEAAAEKLRRLAEDAAEERRQMAAEAAEERRRMTEEAEAIRLADLAEARRLAEASEARRRAEMEEAKREAEAAEARRRAEIEQAKREADAAEAQRRAEMEEVRREAAEAEARRRAEMEEARREAAAAEARRQAEIEEARRESIAAEARRRAEMEEAKRQAEIAAARREAALAAALERQFTEVEARIDALQSGLDDNQVEPIRAELIELVQDMSDLSRSGRATSDGLTAISARLDEMDVKLNAARNMASNRLGDIQDKIETLGDRLDKVEIEVPGFDAVRENQGAILERFDRMEGLVNRLASAEELIARVDGLKRQVQTTAQQREVARIEEQVLKLADRLDAMPAELSDEETLTRIEQALGQVAGDLAEARRQRKSVAIAFDDQLAEITEKLREVAETGRTPDLSGIEKHLAAIAGSLAEDRQSTNDALARLDRRLGVIAAQIEAQEDDTTAEVLADLTGKMDALAASIAAQDASGARQDIGGLDRKLDKMAEQIAAEAQRLSHRQIEPLAQRLEEMQAQFVQIQKRAQDTSALFKPLVQKLHEISDRLAGLETMDESLSALASRNADPRGVHTQLEAILSRLEVLKGRSVDPAKMNELFDRIEFAIRTIPDHAGATIDGDAIPAERLARLEKKLDDVAATVARGGEAPEDIGDLRADIAALRRELRSLPAQNADESEISELMRVIAKRLERIPQEVPAALASLEGQVERLSRALDDPDSGVGGIAAIQASLRTIEKRLDDTRRSLGYRPPREVDEDVSNEEKESAADFARALAEEPSAPKAAAESPEKAKEAIDAVQETLEAVVKRMAFLERDADAAARETRGEKPAEPEFAPEPIAPAQAPESSGGSHGGLLSRFTSRQLLRRATGGRAESFTPEAEEPEEASDLPLEPGTDSPLNSSLTGAPSSDTEFMSGGRKPRAARAGRAHGDEVDSPALEDDFVAAARRAARAAAAEADGDDAEDEEGRAPRRSRRGGIIAASLLAAAIVIAAIAIAQTQVWPYQQVVAFIDDMRATPPSPTAAPTPPSAEIAAAPTAPVMPEPQAPMAAEAPAEPMDLTAAPVVPPVAATPPVPAGELRPEESASAMSVPEPVEPEAAAPSTPPGDMAAVAPVETPAEANTAPAAPATLPSSAIGADDLPQEIGPANLRDAALAGDPIATFEVGARYAEGRGVLQDMPMAVKWYERSAEAGLAPAQYRLGSIYEKGLGVPRDLSRAQDWYRRAADAGNVKAMHNLAVLYAEGAGGEPDLDRASVLFRSAAEHGVRDSQFNLAILHARGLGVSQDLVEAYKWFAVAATSGDEEAAKRREIIGEALSEDDRARAEQLAATFQPLPLVSEANEVQMPDWRAGEPEDATSVEVKSDNELVALVQKLLAENGYDPGPPDGLLGEKTIEAISEFQGKSGLPKTGQIDNSLVAALQNRST